VRKGSIVSLESLGLTRTFLQVALVERVGAAPLLEMAVVAVERSSKATKKPFYQNLDCLDQTCRFTNSGPNFLSTRL